MTVNPIALDLLKLAEHYLSALHGSVARHDNLGLNLSCGGCALRDEIRDVLPTLDAVVPGPPATRAADRDRIAEIEELRKEHATWRKLGHRNLELAHEENARLRAEQAATLEHIHEVVRRLAAHAVGFQDVLDDTDRGPWGATVGADIAELRRMADEAQQQPEGGARRAADEEQPEGEPTESTLYEVVGNWGVDSADSAAGARAAVAKWLRAYPKCGAHAQQRIHREWPDGSEFYGPWTDLPDPS